MDGQHANCRSCHNLVRRDWLRCLHCGVPSPVTRPIGGTLLQAAFLAFATTLATAGGVHAQAIWRFIDQGRLFLVDEGVSVAAVSPLGTPAQWTGDLRTEAPSPPSVARLASRMTSPGALPTVPLVTTAGQDSSAESASARCLASGDVGRRLDDSALVRTIAACTSVAALDSLEAQLHAAFPSDPALQRGARALRRLEARRAQLTSATVPSSTADVGPPAPMR